MAVDPRAPCIVGVGQRTWRPDEVGVDGAPEPLAMWEETARLAAADAGRPGLLAELDSVQVVYCQTTQYDDAVGRLAERLGAAPRLRHYSGIGGTTPQVLVQDQARAVLRGDVDLALVTGAEALATQRAFRKRGEKPPYSFPPAEPRPFPWEGRPHPAEVAHDLHAAWLTFAVWDNARRARLGVGLDAYRRDLGALLAPMTAVAAANPHAWFPVERTAAELVEPSASNRMVGYPYTKLMTSIMDVDMSASVLLASHERADALGVPADRRVYVRGWCYATDPVHVAEHAEMWRSPAMAAASREALRPAGIGVDDVAHLDLYSCFASSVNFARDALGIGPDDRRPVTVTGGLPYFGGPGSCYMTHAIASMAERLREDAGSYGLVSGVGMHMTKHVYGLYSTAPGPLEPPDEDAVQAGLDRLPSCTIRDTYAGPATVAAYSVVHGRDGGPEWGIAVCDLPEPGTRAYAKVLDGGLLADAERSELVGCGVRLTTDGAVNVVAGVTAPAGG